MKNFKLANKDKRLLLTLLIGVIVVAAFFGFKAINGKITEIEEEMSELQTVKDDLTEKYLKKDEYHVKKILYDEMYKDIINSYATGLDEPSIIMDLIDIESSTEAWLKQAGLSNVGVLYTFGGVKSTNPASEGKGVYSTDLVGGSSNTSLSNECTYEQLKSLLSRIIDSNHKYYIGTMAMSYDQADEVVSGSLTLNSYAITGSNRIFPGTDVDGVPVGTENIFVSETHTANPVDKTYLDVMKSDYDVYVTLGDAASDIDSICVGLRSDVLGTSTVSSNSNAEENVEIYVSGKEGKYTISYKVGNNTYPVDNYDVGDQFVFGGEAIDILIISKPRNNANDTSTANLTVVNSTDVEVNVGIINDDEERPRCIIKETSGSTINIFQ